MSCFGGGGYFITKKKKYKFYAQNNLIGDFRNFLNQILILRIMFYIFIIC